MSPLPTPLYRQDADPCQRVTRMDSGTNALDMYAWPAGTTGSAQLDRGVRDDLRNARIKTAIGNLARVLSPACELGKVCTDAKGVCPPMLCRLAEPS
jgi:hypothetical protein